MQDDDILSGTVMEETWITLEQLAAACEVEPAWLLAHVEEGLFPQVEHMSGMWRCSGVMLKRVRRMYRIERDFDAVPELSALVADMLEEMDTLRAQLQLLGRR